MLTKLERDGAHYRCCGYIHHRLQLYVLGTSAMGLETPDIIRETWGRPGDYPE
jgi:hypothetical protein